MLALCALVALTACSGGTPTATPTATVPPPPPTATPTPLPTPTPTPLPPVTLTIRWSSLYSALEAVTVRAELPGLAERDPQATVFARVVDPLQQVWWEAAMTPTGSGSYSAVSPLYLPLDPPPGDWRLTVFVYARVSVNGARTILFRPRQLPLWELGESVPAGVVLHVPKAFANTANEGDAVAGWRIWSGQGGEVGLWWAPGPAEPFTQDGAQMLVEATYAEGVAVEVQRVEALEWAGRPAFRFVEHWPEGEGEALAVQGADRWLYVLRVRALNRQPIPPLLWDIQASFRLQ